MYYFSHPQFRFSFQTLRGLIRSFLLTERIKPPKEFKEIFPGKKIYFTDMGRSAFRLIIEGLKLQNSQIIMPSYICDVFYSLLKDYNIIPVFVDVDKRTFNIIPEHIERVITEKTRAILVCHTYGKAVDIKKIVKIAQKYNLKLIEDCAHSFGLWIPADTGDFESRYAGNFGDAALFSLYKFFPCLRGGMAVFNIPNLKEKELPKTKFSGRDFLSLLNSFPIFSFLFKRFASGAAQKHLKDEKIKKPAEINRISYNIFYWHLSKLKRSIKKRQKLAEIYRSQLEGLGFEFQDETCNIFTYLSALVPRSVARDEFVEACRKQGVFPVRIWKDPIVLKKEVQKEYGLSPTDFPNTLEVAQRIVNFPLQNFYSQKDVLKILEKIKTALKFFKQKINIS